MCCNRVASNLYSEYVAGIFLKEGCLPRTCSRQVYFNHKLDSMGVIHGDDILIEGEDDALDAIDKVLNDNQHI